MAVQDREKIFQSTEVQRRVGSKKVGQETVQNEQKKQDVEKVVEFVLGELNTLQPIFMLHRTVRSICKEEELVFKIMALVLTVTLKTEKAVRKIYPSMPRFLHIPRPAGIPSQKIKHLGWMVGCSCWALQKLGKEFA